MPFSTNVIDGTWIQTKIKHLTVVFICVLALFIGCAFCCLCVTSIMHLISAFESAWANPFAEGFRSTEI